MPIGTVTEWNDEKGFGFITPSEGGQRAFFHISSYPRAQGRPRVGNVVQYTITISDRGAKAETIVPFSNRLHIHLGTGTVVAACCSITALSLIAALAFRGQIPMYVPGIYIFFSIVAFAAYAQDKRSAKAGQWRIPEQSLHFFALLGGWPGAMIAQQLLRHKTKKLSFRIAFWFTVIVNCTALAALVHYGADFFIAWFKEQFDGPPGR